MDSSDYYMENESLVFTADFLWKRGFCCGNNCRHCPYELDLENPRVVSLVPSWTETLLSCEVNIVGRTRYCIHPKNKVNEVPIVGGTKNCDFDKIKKLNPDFVVLDKEENPKKFTESLNSNLLISHVRNLESLNYDLVQFNRKIKNGKINNLIEKSLGLLAKCKQQKSSFEKVVDIQWTNFPGVVTWIKRPENRINKIVYVIWMDPWIRVSKNTFIGSQLSTLGFDKYLENGDTAYPEFEIEDYSRENTLFLFSTEPYCFAKKESYIRKLGIYSAIVDGESYSWFGVRSLNFLEKFF